MSNGALTTVLSISEQTLRALQSAGQVFPVPGVAIAASVALHILELVQAVKSNKEEFIAIGRDSCIIVETVISRVQVSQNGQLVNEPAMLRQDADMLLADMRYIEKCVKKVKKRSVVGRIFNHQVDQDTIQECRERLTHAMSLFGLQSDIEIRKQLAGVSSQLAELLRKTSQPPPPQHQLHQPQPHHLQQPQPHPLQQPQPQWQIPAPSFPAAPSPQPQGPSISTTQYNQSSNVPAPAASPAPPKSKRSQERAERRAARHQGQMNQISQQQMNIMPSNPTGFPAVQGQGFNSFQNIQNHLSPGAGINYSYVAGNVNNVSRDDSFNVAGSGNNINFSFAR